MKVLGMVSMVRVRGRLTAQGSAGLRVRPYRTKKGWRFYPSTPTTKNRYWIASISYVERRRRSVSVGPVRWLALVEPLVSVVRVAEDGRSFEIECYTAKGRRVSPDKLSRLDVQFSDMQLSEQLHVRDLPFEPEPLSP